MTFDIFILTFDLLISVSTVANQQLFLYISSYYSREERSSLTCDLHLSPIGSKTCTKIAYMNKIIVLVWRGRILLILEILSVFLCCKLNFYFLNKFRDMTLEITLLRDWPLSMWRGGRKEMFDFSYIAWP